MTPDWVHPVRIMWTGPAYTAFCTALTCSREIGRSTDRNEARAIAAKHIKENHAR